MVIAVLFLLLLISFVLTVIELLKKEKALAAARRNAETQKRAKEMYVNDSKYWEELCKTYKTLYECAKTKLKNEGIKSNGEI